MQYRETMELPAVEHNIVKPDFCGDMETARKNFKKAAVIYTKALLPVDEFPGYLTFITEIFVILVSTITTGKEKQMSPEKRIEIFLKCYLIAAGYGMQDYDSDQRKAIGCFVRNLMTYISVQQVSKTMYGLLLDFIHDHEEATAAQSHQ